MGSVRQWAMANGGPVAVIIVGLGLITLSPWVGVPIATVGAVWFLLTLAPVQKRIPYRVVRADALIERRLSDEALGERCLALARDLQDDLADYKRNDPRALNWGMSYPRHGTRGRVAQGRAENEHKARFAARFQQRYTARAAWLLHEIAQRGLADQSQLWRASHAGMTGDHGVEELASLLGVVGHRLTEREEGTRATS